jgi:uncharacterized protein
VNNTRERLFEFLRAHQVVTLAVTDADGSPHAAALFYAADSDLSLYVLTDPEARHGQAMLTNGRAAGTIQRDRQQWQEVQGVQFRGRCGELTGEERARAWALYTERFPFLKEKQAALGSAMTKMGVWRIKPTWMRIIDNRQGFGHKDEWSAGG